MSQYDFSTLLWYDFELLTRDLLQKELSVTLESFKMGQDGGVDLRYALEDKPSSIIIQCKHYQRSGYKALLAELKTELQKVKKLEPERYLISTSVGLGPENKKEIMELMHPYIKTTTDIYGLEDLNNLLGKFPEVEKQHFKLWLSSTNVLQVLINADIVNSSEIDVEKMKAKATLYVQTPALSDVVSQLHQHRFCIISGIAGIGKTTLAEMAILHFVKHDFEYVRITRGKGMQGGLKLYNKSKKQIFYYDDFLGETFSGDDLNRNDDGDIVSFIDHLGNSKNHFFLASTREYILKQSQKFSEKIARSDIEISKCILELKDYTRLNKAKILYNHLCFFNTPQVRIDQLLECERYIQIIDHKNFSPRIVEAMTKTKIEASDEAYFNKFIENLNYPNKIWETAYSNNISHHAKALVLTMATLQNGILLEDLEIAFNAIHTAYSKKYNLTMTPTDFRDALNETEGSFTLTDFEDGVRTIKFHNPSINDFIEEFITRNGEIFALLLNNSTYAYQQQKLVKIRNNKKENSKNTAKYFESFTSIYNVFKPLFQNSPPRYSKHQAPLAIPMEENLNQIFSISYTRGPSRDESIAALKEIETRIKIGTASRGYLSESLYKISLHIKKGSEFKKILLLALNYLQSDIHNCYNLGNVADFMLYFKMDFTSEEHEEIGIKIAENLETVEKWALEEGDYFDIEHSIETFKRISTTLDIETISYTSSLQKRLNEIQQEDMENTPKVQSISPEMTTTLEERATIVSLFQNLKKFD